MKTKITCNSEGRAEMAKGSGESGEASRANDRVNGAPTVRNGELWSERDASRLTLVYFVQREQSLHNIRLHHIERTFRLV